MRHLREEKVCRDHSIKYEEWERGGHHYCFIKQAELVFDEMQNFLLEAVR